MERYDVIKTDHSLVEVGCKDGKWVKYEDVKGLELQVMTLTEQLSKMERRTN